MSNTTLEYIIIYSIIAIIFTAVWKLISYSPILGGLITIALVALFFRIRNS